MSTILKALKKLEQDKQAYHAGSLPARYMGPGSTHAKSSSYRFGPKFGTMVRRCMVLIVILSLTGAVYYFYRQSRGTAIQASNSIVPTEKPASEVAVQAKNQAKSSTKSTAQTPESSPMVIPRTQTAVPTPSMPGTPSKVSKPPAVDAELEKAPGQTFSKVNPSAGSRPKTAPTQWQSLKDLAQPEQSTRPSKQRITDDQQREITPVDSKPANESKPPVDKKLVPPEDAYDDIALLTDGRLKVQALAWSPIVEDRMTVINTRILHEGDKVDGFLVLRIRHDDVVVQEKGVRYRVAFGRP